VIIALGRIGIVFSDRFIHFTRRVQTVTVLV
jgi:hypothetical protein